MLKSEALDAIIRISDKKERRFEEFRLDCDKLSKVSIEYPELAHYLIDAAIVIATDKNFNSDVAPGVQSAYAEIDHKLSLEESYKAICRLYQQTPIFALKTMGQVVTHRPDLAEKLFDQVLQDSKMDTYNDVATRSFALAQMILAVDNRAADNMLGKIFSHEQCQNSPTLVKFLYNRLGRFYTSHPQMERKIFDYLTNPQYLTPASYGNLYNNLLQVAMFSPQLRDEALNLCKKYIADPQNDPFDIAEADNKIAPILSNENTDAAFKKQLEEIVKIGLDNPANNEKSQKAAWRALNDYEKLRSSFSLGQRVEKDEQNAVGWRKNAKIAADEVCIAAIGGDGVRCDKAANGYLGDIFTLIKENDLQDKVKVYGVVYDFGDFMDTRQARTQTMHDYHRKVNAPKNIAPDTIDPKYITQIFEQILLPRIATEDGKKRLSAEEAATRVRRLNLVTHCHGAYTALKLEEIMQNKMRELGYSEAERRDIQKQLLIVSYAPYCPLGVSKSTMISFASLRDDEVSHHNNFDKIITQMNHDNDLPLCYFPGKQGNLFVVSSLGTNMDQHNFWGFRPSYEMGTEGEKLTRLAANVLVSGIKNSLQENPRLPEVPDLVATDDYSKELFDEASANGKAQYERIVKTSRAMHRKNNDGR